MSARTVLLTLWLATPISAALAAPPGPPPGHSPAGPREGMREEVMNRIRTMRMIRITEELKPDEETAGKMFAILTRADDEERELWKQQRELYRQLRDAARVDKPDQAKLKALVDQIVAGHGRRATIEDEKIKALRRILSPVQAAKLVLLLPEIDHGIRRDLRRFMDGRDGDKRDDDGKRDDRDGRRGPRGL